MSRLEELIKEFCFSGTERISIGSIVNYEQPSKYLVGSTDYNDDFSTPVLTAGQTFILGYTNEENNLYNASKENPVIIFDDFTGAFKWVDFPFKVKSSAMKMLTANPEKTTLRYIYHIMGNIGFSSDEHKRLWISRYSEIKIPLPPLPVQQEIVRILDNFTNLTAELTAELTARKKQYEYYASALIKGNSDNLEYDKIALGDVAEFTYGFTDKAKESGSARFIRITDIGDNGCLKIDNEKYIDLTEESEKYLLKTGDIIMARTGATYGKTLYMPNDEPAVYASFLIKITLDQNKILNRFYWHFTRTELYWAQANKLVSTGGQPQFNTGAISRVVVPVPPIKVQNRIVELLDRFDVLCNDISIGLPAEIEARRKQYEYYRDKLLTFKELA